MLLLHASAETGKIALVIFMPQPTAVNREHNVSGFSVCPSVCQSVNTVPPAEVFLSSTYRPYTVIDVNF